MTQEESPLAHDRARYRRGCRCGVCREANREYQRQWRAKPSLRPLPSPPADSAPAVPALPGPVAAAVAAQVENMAGAEERPGLVAIALALAAILDNPNAIPQHAAAAHRLMEVLTTLSKSSTRRGRLSMVRGMTDG